MVRLQNRMTDIFPAVFALKDSSLLKPDLRELPVVPMGILVERDRTPSPQGEVGIPHPEHLGIPGDAMLVLRLLLNGGIFDGEVKGGAGLRRLPIGAKDRKPILDLDTGDHEAGRYGHRPDGLRAEDVVILDMEHEGSGAVGEGNLELLVPYRVLGVRDDAGSGNGGVAEAGVLYSTSLCYFFHAPTYENICELYIRYEIPI